MIVFLFAPIQDANVKCIAWSFIITVIVIIALLLSSSSLLGWLLLFLLILALRPCRLGERSLQYFENFFVFDLLI